MDYPITVPGVGLSAGKFTNGNPLASLAASLDPAEWANAVTDEILNVITQGGLTPTENTNTQLATAIRNMIRGGDYKDSVRFTTSANIVLTGLGTQAGGNWPAALTAADRILVKNQTAGAENGIYTAAAGAWVRATDADTGAELNSGAIIPVESGTTLADTNWQLTTDGVVIIGTTALTFADMRYQESGYLVVRDERAPGADGGSSIAGVQTRVLNTITTNSIAGASLSANQITLPAGKYRVNGSTIGFNVNDHVCFLRNVTDAINLVIGTSENTTNNGTDPVGTRSVLLGKFTLDASKVLDFRHYTELAIATHGLGRTNTGPSLPAVFTLLEFFKEY